MLSDFEALRLQVTRQVAHWSSAMLALDDLQNFAPASAWAQLEREVGVAVRSQLGSAVSRLQRRATVLRAELDAAETYQELDLVRRHVIAFRRQFLAVETNLEFVGDAIGTRSNERTGALLRACDVLASRSMEAVLVPLGRRVPPVLTWVEGGGLGASILRADLRLWDGRSINVAATIKVTRHNLVGKPTAILHEAGHQVGFMLDWSDEVADAFRSEFSDAPDIGESWAQFASEISCDAYAFAHAGYAAVAALHDVVAGTDDQVWRDPLLDSHPPASLRVLANTAMAQRFFGAGPWDDLASSWTLTHPPTKASSRMRRLYDETLERMPRIVEILLLRPMRAFGGRALVSLVDPAVVRPDALAELERSAGAALFSSPHWLRSESIRLLALTGYRLATEPARATEYAQRFEEWMTRLGDSQRAVAA